MADVRQTITRTEDVGVDNTGAAVTQQTKQVHTDASADGQTTAQNAVWYVLGVIEILLALRFIFKLFGANPRSAFVDFIYDVSRLLTAPFDNIFGVSATTAGQTRSVFEPSILVAAAVYALIAWGIARLITLNQKNIN